MDGHRQHGGWVLVCRGRRGAGFGHVHDGHNDYGAFSGTTYYAAASGVYAAGTASNSRGNLNSYYAGIFPGGQTAPAAQQAAYSQQTGGLAVGTIGFAWRDVIISKSGDTVEWSIDGLKMATITGASFTASNIFIGLWDSFASLSDNTNLSFAVFDNVRVERVVTNVPPYLTVQPQAQAVCQGNNATFNVTAGGTAPLSYQWRCNGTNVVGGNSSACTLTNALPAHGGSYTVVVTNCAGSVTSSVASLVVTNPPPAMPGRFDLISLLTDGSFQLSMSGSAGSHYILQASSDLMEWSNLSILSGADGSLSWVAPCATNGGQRFYRLRSP